MFILNSSLMKHLKTFSIIALVAILFSSCKLTPHDKISGKWKISEIENTTMTLEEDIEFFNQMNEELIKSQVITFEEAKITKSYPEALEGTWEMDEDGTVLTIDWGQEDTYSPHTYSIKTLTKDSLVVEEDFDEFFIITSYVKAE